MDDVRRIPLLLQCGFHFPFGSWKIREVSRTGGEGKTSLPTSPHLLIQKGVFIMSKKLEKIHESDNELLTEVSNSLILEAISHFNTTRSRLREGDERYFYKWDEVDAVLSQLKDPDSVSIQVEKDFDGSVFCYIMNFSVLKKETRVR